MKKTLTFLALLASSTLLSQATLTQNIPATGGSSTTFRAPNGTSAHTTHRAHYIIPATELTALPNGAKIVVAGFNYISGVNTTASGNLKFYMENTTATTNTKSTTWTTAITGMDTLFNAAYSFPVTTGAMTTSFTLSDTFTYTGGGIFIAYDYLGSQFATTAAVYDCNTGVSGGLKMIESATSTPGATLTGTSSWRPMLTIQYANPFTNDMIVDKLMVEKGHPNKLISTSQTVKGIVRNKSRGTLTSKVITLNITGANPHTATHTIASLGAGVSDTITFSGLSLTNNGNQIVKLKVPSDQFAANDSLVYSQTISCDTIGHPNNGAVTGGVGFNTGAGILATKLTGSSVIPISVKSVVVKLSVTATNTGNSIKGVLLDTGGNIIDSSASVIITTAHLGKNVVLNLTGTNTITTANNEFYIGFRQTANTTTGYFPLATQMPNPTEPNKYYGIGEYGGTPTEYSTLGTFMINATVSTTSPVTISNSSTNDTVCAGTAVTFTAAGGSIYTSYDFTVNGTSMQNTASSIYSFTPTMNSGVQVSGMYNTCPTKSSLDSIIVLTSLDTSISVSSPTYTANFSGGTYQWINCATNMPVSGATNKTFTPSSSGTYKVIVAMGICSDTSGCIHMPFAGINELENIEISIFPNPAKDKLTISYQGKVVNQITIMDVNGKLINSTRVNSNKVVFNTEKLNSGVYFVKIQSDNGVSMRKFIKE